MKKLFIILLTALLLVSCTKAPAENPDVSFEDIDLSGKTITVYDQTAVVLSDGVLGGGFFDYKKLAKKLDCTIDVKTYQDNVQFTKILAGDSDIDIYVINSDEAELLSNAGALYTIQSDKVKAFNSKCFDSLQEFSVNKDGDTVLMPVAMTLHALFAPKEAVEELGITADDVRYLYDYLDYIKNYNGERKVYSAPAVKLFIQIDRQYGYAYCDYENGKFDYNTDVYKKYYSTLLDGWSDDNLGNPWYATHDPYLNTYKTADSLFVIDSFGSRANLQGYYNNWVAFPIPRLDESVDKIPVSGKFLCINPNSLQLGEAEKVLEYISDHYYDVKGPNSKSNMIFKDVSMYPNKNYDDPVYINTESEVFKNFMEIVEDTVVFQGVLNGNNRDDLIGYQSGKYTIDEAIEVRSREVDIMLNE